MARGELVEIDHRGALAALALVAGVLSLLLLAASLQPPPPPSADWFSFVARHRTTYASFASLVLAWAVFSVPVIVTSGAILHAGGMTLARIAQLLSAVGVLLLGFAIFLHTAILLSIVTAGGAMRPEDAGYHAAVLSNLRYYATDPGLMTWGLGQFLFGWLARSSRALPGWVAAIGMIGGIAGLLTLAVYQTGALALVQLASFIVWCFAVAIVLFRRRER